MLKKGVLAVGATVALVAAGSAAASHQSVSAVTAAKHSASGTRITLHKTKLGKVLATSSGKTLYLYTPDARNKSNCYTGCAGFWRPPPAPAAIDGRADPLHCAVHRRRDASVRRRWIFTSTRARISSAA